MAQLLWLKTDIDKYWYSGYGIAFDRRRSFSFPGIGLRQNVITFGADASSLTKIDNREKDILTFDKGPTQGLEHTLSAVKFFHWFYSDWKEILFKPAL